MDERWAVATARIAALNLIVSFFAGGVKNEPMSASEITCNDARVPVLRTYVLSIRVHTRTYVARVVVRGVVSLLF